MSDHDHGHIPYVILLLYYLERWKDMHSGVVPSTYREKSEFRELVKSGMRTQNAEGGEENYEEAVAAVLKSLNEPTANSAAREVFTSPECTNLTRDVRPLVTDDPESSPHPNKKLRLTPTPLNGAPQSSNFWVVAHAISTFYSKHGVLPLPGSVPDMKAQSNDYIALQNIYKAKARRDAEEVLATVRSLERQLGREDAPVDAAEVDAFCKNAGHIKLVRGRPFHVVTPGAQLVWGERARWAANALTDDSSKLPLYLAFLAWDTVCATGGVDGQRLTTPRPPGLLSEDVQDDAGRMAAVAAAIVAQLLKEAGRELESWERDTALEFVRKFAAELARAGGAELHNIAALAGGLVAQEVIKVVTKQYIPVDNTCLFDGVLSESAVIRI